MDPASLRCDFLKPDDDRITFVDFTFEISGKRFHIHRQPKQSVAKKRGSGRRELGQEALLECVGHEEFSAAHKDRRGRSQDRRSRRPRRRAVQKIVMLPQGAFQEFSFPRRRTRSSSCVRFLTRASTISRYSASRAASAMSPERMQSSRPIIALRQRSCALRNSSLWRAAVAGRARSDGGAGESRRSATREHAADCR